MGKKVSMQQIADAVGLSKYAVSKALAGKEGVSEKARERIMEAAAQLGYFRQKKTNSGVGSKPVRAAEEWDREKTAVAILMPNVRLQTMDSSFWSLVVNGIGKALSRAGLGMLIYTEQTAEHFERVLKPEHLLGVIGVGQISTSMLLALQRLGLPFVLTDHEDSLVPSDTVFASNLDSMAMMTGHLLALGHRSFCFLGDTRFSRSFMDRWVGFRKTLEEQEVEFDARQSVIPVSGIDRSENVSLIREWLDEWKTVGSPTLPTAWVCANDEIALAMLTVLQEQGVRVPAEASVTGFDNIADSQRSLPQLTTVHVNKEQLGERAVAALLDRIKEPQRPHEKISISCELVIRSSTGEQ